MSSNVPILLGTPLRNQICATGVESSICPSLYLLTLDCITSTPHLSHTTRPVLHSLVFSAYALPVFHRAEDFCTEKAVTLRLERTVVYRLRFLNLSIRPLPYFSGEAILILSASKSVRIFRLLKIV